MDKRWDAVRIVIPTLLAALVLCLVPETRALHAQATQVSPPEGDERPRRARTSRRRTPAEPEAPLGKFETDENFVSKVTAGRIRVRTLFQYIEDATGRLMLFPTLLPDPHFSAEMAVEFLTDVDGFDATLARAVLTANGYIFTDSALENGRQVTYLSHASSRQAPPPRDIQQVFGPGDEIPAGQGHGLLVVNLSYANVETVIVAFRQIFEVSGGPMINRISMVAVPESGQVLVNSSYANLRTVRELVVHLDKKPRESAPRTKDPKD